jgi:NAD(P) transhydrogenase subunit alpha
MTFVQNLTLFVLAAFVGYEVITRIPTNLHTPLMSGANAISGITLVGAVVVAGSGENTLATALGFLAVVIATINVVGGYLVSHFMLEEFSQGGG